MKIKIIKLKNSFYYLKFGLKNIIIFNLILPNFDKFILILVNNN